MFVSKCNNLFLLSGFNRIYISQYYKSKRRKAVPLLSDGWWQDDMSALSLVGRMSWLGSDWMVEVS